MEKLSLKSRYHCLCVAFILVMLTLLGHPCLAKEPCEFKLTFESPQLVDSPFFLNTAADLNKNGKKELIISDFGRFGDHMGELQREKHEKAWEAGKGLDKKGPIYNFFVLEWEQKELKLKFSKQWDTTTREGLDKFQARNANQIVSWTIGDSVIVETIPPYLGLEWVHGKYALHEQHTLTQEGPWVGSWALSWLSPSCYGVNFPSRVGWPRECLVGIRDFSGTGKPRVVSIYEEKIGDRQYKQRLRVRRFEIGFPIEWEMMLDPNYYFGQEKSIDRLNWKARDLFLMTALLLSDKSISKFIFEPTSVKERYLLKQIQMKDDMGLYLYDLPDVYLRSTQKMGFEEYWSYYMVENPQDIDLNFMLRLRRVTLNPDLTGFIKEDIDFPHHKNFVGVGFFTVEDIDGDGLDEIILIEETSGKFEPYGETVHFLDIKDYIRILKWNGKEYQTMWVSPPYTKRGTKFLVEDIKNAGKKQLVVLSPYGTVQIWEKQ